MSDKGKRGGKHSKDLITAKQQRHKRRMAEKKQLETVTYDFYNPVLGYRPVPGRNREEAIKNAEQLGYKATDLVKRKRKE